MSSIEEIERLLEETARKCLRLIGTKTLTSAQNRQLAKWMFGCLNQRFTIRERVDKRGLGELAKVLTFVARACEELLQIGDDLEQEGKEHAD